MKGRHGTLWGACVALSLAFSLVSVPALTGASAQSAGIQVSSIGFERTAIIEFENNSDRSIDEVRIWLPPGASLESFKSEDGWTGKERSGLLVFTAVTPISTGESVKFGLKADTAGSDINWEVRDASDTQVGNGVSQPVSIKTPEAPPDPPEAQATPGAIHDVSSFRLVPDKPKVGDTIRVAGMSFAANQPLNFYINERQHTVFETDSDGNFVVTAKIPDNTEPGRVNFAVRDSEENERHISIRVGEAESRAAGTKEVQLTVNGPENIIHRGDVLRMTGTANPAGTVTVQITDPEQNPVTAEPRPVDDRGNWSFDTIVGQDAPYGQYRAVITDGQDTIDRSWSVESSKVIEITPTTLKFEPGELMRFNGTAIPNQSIEFILENPQGTEIFSDVKNVDESGYVEFTYQTEQSSQEGTYVLVARQGDSTEIILTGLGELPKEYIVITMDKPNYRKADTATVNIDGPASATLTLLVVDPSDREKFIDNEVRLQPDGKLAYRLDLKDYASGVYTLILSRANTKASESFSVGLDFGAGEITISTTKQIYKTNDSITLLGEANDNVLVNIQLIDPDGNVVKEAETFTNKDGKITESSFRIPTNAKAGQWQIKAYSGHNFATTNLEVVATVQEGVIVVIEGIEHIAGAGDVVKFRVIGAQNTVKISITDEAGNEIDLLSSHATKAGVVMQPWPVPDNLPPGTYTINATDAFDSGSAKFILQ